MKALVKECWFLLNPLIYVEFGKPCPSGGFIFLFTNATADTGRQYLYYQEAADISYTTSTWLKLHC